MSRRNFIAFVCGRKGSGKSFLLARMLAKFPRVLTLDAVGERADESPDAVLCWTLEQTLDALEECATRSSWHIVSMLESSRAGRLFHALAPEGMHPSGGYSRAVGGMCVECAEADTIAPNNASIDPRVVNAFVRGRHYGLSILAATWTPYGVNRIVTRGADVLVAFQTRERRDVQWLGGVMGDENAARVPSLPKWHHLRYFIGTGVAELVDPAGVVLRRYGAEQPAEQLPLDSS